MKIFYSEEHKKHFPKGELVGGAFVRPFECPERCDFILASLKQAGFQNVTTPKPLDLCVIEKVHSPDYIHFLKNAWKLWQQEGFSEDALPTAILAKRMREKEPECIEGKLGFYCMAIDTAITFGTWDAAQASAAVALSAQNVISDGENVAFALCRPPGHHAAKDLYGGYCFLNNAAIAAQGFLEKGASKVAILDVDFHHGNGTQDIFYDRSDVLFLSLHGDPKQAFPYFLGYADECGKGQGEGFNANYPMPPNTAFSVWNQALEQALKKIQRYKPDFLVISLGTDTFEKDPIGFFQLTSNDFLTYGNTLACLKIPTLFVMEGGYAVKEIGINTVNVLQVYLNS